MIEKKTRLQRVPDMDIRIRSGNRISFIGHAALNDLSEHSLLILHAFDDPKTIGEALNAVVRQLPATSHFTIAQISETILKLHEVGLLVEETSAELTVTSQYASGGYGNFFIHRQMLQDEARTRGWLAAIRVVVQPDDVVVDLGTGTGVLAIAAARAGARRVYALEASNIAGVAQQMFEANKVADTVELVRGFSTDITLPEKATVYVSEMLGNDPFSERILETIVDARQRFLTADARMIPQGVAVYALPLQVPPAYYQASTIDDAFVSAMQQQYQIDFSPLQASAHDTLLRFLPPQRASQWQSLAQATNWLQLDLRTLTSTHIDLPSLPMTITQAGELNGILLYMDIVLTDTHTLSLHPQQAHVSNHWSQPLIILQKPLPVKAGEQIRLHGRYQNGWHDLQVERL